MEEPKVHHFRTAGYSVVCPLCHYIMYHTNYPDGEKPRVRCTTLYCPNENIEYEITPLTVEAHRV